MLRWESLYYLHQRREASSEQYVQWAIREMESGIEDENVVALACLDFMRPLNHFEVIEAFTYVLQSGMYRIPTEEEAAVAYVRFLFQQMVGQWQWDVELLKQMINIAREENLSMERELYVIEERVEEAIYGDNVEKWTEEEVSTYLYEQLSHVQTKLFLSPTLQLLIGEVIERVESEPTFVLTTAQYRLVISGAWHIRQGSKVIVGNEDGRVEDVKQTLQNELISYVHFDEATSLLTLQMGAYTLHIFQNTASDRGWDVHSSTLKK